MKSWLQDKIDKFNSTYNEEEFVVAERMIRTLKNKIDKYMISMSKYFYIDTLDDIVDKYNNI